MSSTRPIAPGYTLVELLVVIVILCVLAGLLLPAGVRARARARATICANVLRQHSLALHMYVHENGGAYPYVGLLHDPAREDATQANWFNKLEPYSLLFWTNRVSHCPGYKGAIVVPAGPNPAHDPLGSFAYNWRGVRGFTRGKRGEVNLGLGMSIYDTVRHPARNGRPVAEPQVKVPSEMLAIGESRFRQETKTIQRADGVSAAYCGYLREAGRRVTLPERHGKNYNQAFCDGHIASIDPWKLFNPTNTAVMWNNDHQPHRDLWPPF